LLRQRQVEGSERRPSEALDGVGQGPAVSGPQDSRGSHYGRDQAVSVKGLSVAERDRPWTGYRQRCRRGRCSWWLMVIYRVKLCEKRQLSRWFASQRISLRKR
jgi:hypothetical protein